MKKICIILALLSVSVAYADTTEDKIIALLDKPSVVMAGLVKEDGESIIKAYVSEYVDLPEEINGVIVREIIIVPFPETHSKQ